MVKRPVDQTQKGTPYGVGVHVQNGHRGEEVIGKEVGSSPGLSRSPPITILISFTVAGFRPLPSQVYMYIRQLSSLTLFLQCNTSHAVYSRSTCDAAYEDSFSRLCFAERLLSLGAQEFLAGSGRA